MLLIINFLIRANDMSKLPMSILSSGLSTTEAFARLSHLERTAETGRLKSTGSMDPLELVRLELLAVQILMRIGRIQLTNGGMDIRESQL